MDFNMDVSTILSSISKPYRYRTVRYRQCEVSTSHRTETHEYRASIAGPSSQAHKASCGSLDWEVASRKFISYSKFLDRELNPHTWGVVQANSKFCGAFWLVLRGWLEPWVGRGHGGGCQGPGKLACNSKCSPTRFVEGGLAEELEKGPNLVEEAVPAVCSQRNFAGGV